MIDKDDDERAALKEAGGEGGAFVESLGRTDLATWTPGGDEGERISMEPFAEALSKFDRNKDGGIDKDRRAATSMATSVLSRPVIGTTGSVSAPAGRACSTSCSRWASRAC